MQRFSLSRVIVRRTSDTRGHSGFEYSILGCPRRITWIPVSFLGFLCVRFGGLAFLWIVFRRPKGLHCQAALCLVNPSGSNPAFRYPLLPCSRFEFPSLQSFASLVAFRNFLAPFPLRPQLVTTEQDMKICSQKCSKIDP